MESDEYYTWRPSSLIELTPIIFNIGLTHLCSEAFISKLSYLKDYILMNNLPLNGM